MLFARFVFDVVPFNLVSAFYPAFFPILRPPQLTLARQQVRFVVIQHLFRSQSLQQALVSSS